MANDEPGRSWVAESLIAVLSGLAAGLAMALAMFVLRWALGIPTPAELLGDRLAPHSVQTSSLPSYSNMEAITSSSRSESVRCLAARRRLPSSGD